MSCSACESPWSSLQTFLSTNLLLCFKSSNVNFNFNGAWTIKKNHKLLSVQSSYIVLAKCKPTILFICVPNFVANSLDLYRVYVLCCLGVVYYYGLLQIAMWLLFHSGALFWGIVFPFHYRRWKNEGRFKYIHITTVILALLVPTIPAFVNLRFGYAVFSSPTFACQGNNNVAMATHYSI